MEISSAEIILYVSDQQRSRMFYAALLQREPILDVQGMTEFRLSPNLRLGLMPESGIGKILANRTPHPALGNGIPRCELYIRTSDAQLAYDHAVAIGAIAVSEVIARDWGDTVGYVADHDGHVIAFAHQTALRPARCIFDDPS